MEDDKGLSFWVNGFVYCGIVVIEYDKGSDTFSVIVNDERTEDVHVGELIDVLDVSVEAGDMGQDEYEECLNDWSGTEVME